jgi:peptidylprolyl isomerase
MSSHPNRKQKPSTIKARDRNKKLAVIAIVVVAAIVIGAFVMYSQGSPGSTNPTPTSTPSPTPTSSTNASPSPSPSGPVKVLFQTSMGNITIQLRADKPITSGNFEKVVRDGVLDGTLFHRVIAGFMIQGGMNTTAQLTEIPDEIGSNNSNVRGTIAMANAGPNTATSQFFINTVDNGNNVIDQAGHKFDSAYTTFGQVIAGMDVVDAISRVPVGPNPYTGENSQPLQSVTLIKATILP